MIDYYETVKKLIGPIEPVGETNVDEVRMENLKAMTGMLDTLLGDIMDVARHNIGRTEYSMKQAGKHAHNFLHSIGIDGY